MEIVLLLLHLLLGLIRTRSLKVTVQLGALERCVLDHSLVTWNVSNNIF